MAITEITTCNSSSRLSPLEKLDFISQRLWVFDLGIGWKGFHDIFYIMERGLGYIVFVKFLECLMRGHVIIDLFRQASEKFTGLAIPWREIDVFVTCCTLNDGVTCPLFASALSYPEHMNPHVFVNIGIADKHMFLFHVWKFLITKGENLVTWWESLFIIFPHNRTFYCS